MVTAYRSNPKLHDSNAVIYSYSNDLSLMTKYCVVFHNPKGKAFLVMNEWDDGVYYTSLVGLVILIKLLAILCIRKEITLYEP